MKHDETSLVSGANALLNMPLIALRALDSIQRCLQDPISAARQQVHHESLLPVCTAGADELIVEVLKAKQARLTSAPAHHG